MTDPLLPLLLVLRYMHILGAIALMGGTIFARFALVPSAAQVPSDLRPQLHELVRSRWSKVVMAAAALLLVSGITNLALSGRFDYEPVLGMPKGYQMLTGVKFLLALPIFFIASLLAGRSGLATRVQASSATWMNINLTLALVMVLIGGLLKFVARKPKAEDGPPPAVSWLDPEISSKALPFHFDSE